MTGAPSYGVGFVLYNNEGTFLQTDHGPVRLEGGALSRTDYPELYSLIQTSFGAGDGETTFNLPDLRAHVKKGTTMSDWDKQQEQQQREHDMWLASGHNDFESAPNHAARNNFAAAMVGGMIGRAASQGSDPTDRSGVMVARIFLVVFVIGLLFLFGSAH